MKKILLTVVVILSTLHFLPSVHAEVIACTMQYDPVCGVDNVTYGNACTAGKTAIAHTGECTPIVGGDRDEHGCIGSAGYSWDAAWNSCVRPWEIEQEKKVFTFAQENAITSKNTYPDFRSKDTITREEASSMFVRLAENVYNQQVASFPENCNARYADNSAISSDFREIVYTACAHGIMVGSQGSFMPKESLTEGQALTVIARIIGATITQKSSILGIDALEALKKMDALTDEKDINFNANITRGKLIQWMYSVHEATQKNQYTAIQGNLDAAKKLWNDKGPKEYTLQQQISCFCMPNYNLAYEYKVTNNVIDTTTIHTVDTTLTLPAEHPEFKTISEAFVIIQNAINEKAADIQVTYDAQLGYPKSISIDRSKMMADEELYYTFSVK